jgi:predicted nucleic acid-binding protein
VRVYLDAAPAIYLVENIQPLAAAVEAYLARPGAEVIASDLTRLECRVKPMRDAYSTLLRQFDEFFETTVHEIVPLSREVMDRATELRARLGFGTPDAIHVAAALTAGCDVFLTNDHRLNRAVGIQVEVV